jgi:hypothetical protein
VQARRLAKHPREPDAFGGVVGHHHGAAAFGREFDHHVSQRGRLSRAGPRGIEQPAAEHQCRRPRAPGVSDRRVERVAGRSGDRRGDGRGCVLGHGDRPVERRIEGEDEIGHGRHLHVTSDGASQA